MGYPEEKKTVHRICLKFWFMEYPEKKAVHRILKNFWYMGYPEKITVHRFSLK